MKEASQDSVKQTQAATSTPNQCLFDLTVLIDVADSENVFRGLHDTYASHVVVYLSK